MLFRSILLSQAGRCCDPGREALSAPVYPYPIQSRSSINLWDPDWKVGNVDSYSVGFQRGLSKDMALEVRYIGTRGHDLFGGENWNEINIVENGFLDEFKNAQKNLYANVAANRGQSLAYFGPNTGTVPLPIFLAYFNGQPAANAGDRTLYTGSNWTNTTIVGRFAQLNPLPLTSAGTDLQGSATLRNNALNAGLPSNFFTLNGDVSSVNVSRSKESTRYDSVQVNLRRRLSGGFSLDTNYTYSKRWVSRLDSLRVNRYLVRSTDEVPHALKMTATWDLPVGRGRRFGTDMNAIADGIAGGWSVNLTGKVQSGQVLNYGNVRLIGMDEKELQDSIGYYEVTATNGQTRVYNLPLDIINATAAAFNFNVLGYANGAPSTWGRRYLAPANGPDCIQVVRGDCAPKDLFITAPPYTRFDFSAKKAVRTGGRTNIVLEIDVLNMFNAINFNPTISTSTNTDNYRVTSSYSDVNGTFDPGSRVGQLVLRFNF